MRHNFENGKWMPEDGTFVKVTNDQIPEVIQMIRDNGQLVWSKDKFSDRREQNAIIFRDEWLACSIISTRDIRGSFELPFPDFKALVTGKLPESWCIKCTERNRTALNESFTISPVLGRHYFKVPETGKVLTTDFPALRDVLQIETWAALNPVEESRSDEDEDVYGKDFLSGVDTALQEAAINSTDEQLIN